MNEGDILAAVQAVNTNRCDPPLPEMEISAIVASSCKHPAGRSITAIRPSSAPEAVDRTWPAPLGDAALIGIAGDAVRLIGPTTESDPAAVLFQILVFFGNVIGRSAHWTIEETQHFTNLFAVIVGSTSKGRKGTSLDRVRSMFKGVDDDWEKRNQSGLSSGEGLIWAVRDPIIDTVAIKERGKKTTYEEEQVDAGEKDKRLLVVESEFSRVLNVVQRDGNTLSDVIRDAWDGRALGTMTKTKRARCTEPHVSIIGHITSDELKRLLTSTDIANGLANRFLFVCAKRSKVLPFGGEVVDWTELRVRLRAAITNAKRTDELLMDTDAKEKWARVYEALSGDSGGMYGSVTGRAEAQVRRLACLYALLDESPVIQLVHLDAGLEAWRYCEDSCRFIFSDTLGDPTADTILAKLRQSVDGMTRTDIAKFFQKHKKADEIERALQTLLRIEKARFERGETGGRPTERWFAV
ncbi:MAG: DUF3987 domain-containing protein [Gammaproteobacteria bacterium]|nr:DUF3987 domain-containing protein [Gammaproteobacteria bacterium]